MQTCNAVVELMTDYLEGRMPWRTRLAFVVHLALCPACRRYLKQLRLTIHTLGALPPEPLPEKDQAALLARFRNKSAGNLRPPPP